MSLGRQVAGATEGQGEAVGSCDLSKRVPDCISRPVPLWGSSAACDPGGALKAGMGLCPQSCSLKCKLTAKRGQDNQTQLQRPVHSLGHCPHFSLLGCHTHILRGRTKGKHSEWG